MAKPFEPRCSVIVEHGWAWDDYTEQSYGKFVRLLREEARKYCTPNRKQLKRMRMIRKAVCGDTKSIQSIRAAMDRTR